MGQSEAATVKEIKAAVDNIEKAFADQDRAAIERMFTPDHISIAARYGGPVRLPEQFDTLVALKRKTFDATDLDVTLLSADTALVTYEESYSGTFDDEALPPRVFISQIWVRRDGAWQQRFFQETSIPSDSRGALRHAAGNERGRGHALRFDLSVQCSNAPRPALDLSSAGS